MDTGANPIVRSKRELLDDGWTDGALQRAVRSGRLVAVRAGQYAPVNTDGLLARTIAAVRSTSGSAVSHRSAALLLGLPILGPPPPAPELTVGGRRTGDVLDAHLYRAQLPACHVTQINGERVTSAARTVTDLGRCQSLSAAVIAGDAALRQGSADRAELAHVLADCRGWPGVRRARTSVGMLDGRAESPLESYSRVRLILQGIPTPDLQPVLTTRSGAFVARVDFYWDDAGVVGEADGHEKYEHREVLIEEKRRQERLEELGLVVVRWTWSDVRDARNALVGRLERAFDRGRQRDAHGVTRQWRAHPLSLNTP